MTDIEEIYLFNENFIMVTPCNRYARIKFLFGLEEKSTALVLFSMGPGPMGEFKNEHFTCPSKDHRGLGCDHPNILISLHNLLDPSKREAMILEVTSLLDFSVLICPEQLEMLLLLLLLLMVVELRISLVGDISTNAHRRLRSVAMLIHIG
ncbi:hypothetical protein IEQ34_021294 [Dendrobium chrysotoxum]|uniref:Uncharacterized protein n=1 Tax=Dendrobium chrysotoxum TaxID=161865 RepID=A0AAV7G554_DENCH|nr:hypothetical protein IEQ34_021294 [Dendrobium chrysotoxum]